MRLITGDECGILKECIPELSRGKGKTAEAGKRVEVTKDKGVMRVNTSDDVNRKRGIVGLAWIDRTKDTSFACLRIDGSVTSWERCADGERGHGAYRRLESVDNVFDDDLVASDVMKRPVSLDSFVQEEATFLCVCSANGKAVILDSADLSVVKRFTTFEESESNPAKYPMVTTTAIDHSTLRLAVGGRDRETTFFDLNTGKQLWKAKNMPPDPQTLLQPLVWPTCILFMKSSEHDRCDVMVVGTAHRQLRVYDISQDSKQRRPISVTPNGLLEHRVMSLCQLDYHRVVAGDSAGYIHTIDLRKLGKDPKESKKAVSEGRYVGPSGSIRKLVRHEDSAKLVAVGLDRMLHVYNTVDRKEVCCMYLKQRQNCVLLGEQEAWELDEDGNVVDSDIDQDDVVNDYVASDEEGGFSDEDSDDSVSTNRVESEDEEPSVDGSEPSDDDMSPRKKQKQ